MAILSGEMVTDTHFLAILKENCSWLSCVLEDYRSVCKKEKTHSIAEYGTIAGDLPPKFTEKRHPDIPEHGGH
jgi:hypothetical protein